MTKNEDDFWNTSSSSGFNFDDEEDSRQVFDEFVFHSAREETSSLPIHLVISKTCLDLVLDDIKSTNEYLVPPVEETIKKIFNGHKYTLQPYRQFQEKMLLLDKALEIHDGSIILKVILFLKSTLKSNLFFHQLAKRKVAIKHYSYYLMVNKEVQELIDFYMATGNNYQMKELYYLIGNGINNKDILHMKLEQFMAEHLQKLNTNDDRTELLQSLQLIQWQIERKENANSVVHQLAILCKDELDKNKNNLELTMEFKKTFKIDGLTFEWTIMNVVASMKMWPQLKAMFIKPNWLTKKNVMKTSFNPEIFVNGLSKHDPPKEVLEQYLECIPDTEKSLNLAHKLQCHNFVIQLFISQRDRLALISYKGKVEPQTPEYFLIEIALQSGEKKWKN